MHRADRPIGQTPDGRWTGTGLVFTTRFGTPIEPRNFNRSFDRRIAKAKVTRITVHDARRTCGSLLATLEVHPRVAMQILRHSKIAVTMEIYTEAKSALLRLDMIAGAFSKVLKAVTHPGKRSPGS